MAQSSVIECSALDRSAAFSAVMQLADDHLIIGHRLSEWCGHAPMLEEDLSLPNIALDLIGQSRNLYQYAAELEGQGRTEDDLAYLRTDRQYLNCLLVEHPNTDFAYTMLRQLYFSAFMQPFWEAVVAGTDAALAAIAGKALKEANYHVRHASEWVIRLGDGTDESAKRMQYAVSALHCYTDELFVTDAARTKCVEARAMPSGEQIKAHWLKSVQSVFMQAKIDWPDLAYFQYGGREGRHTEDFGYLLAELQYMQRTYPGAQW